MDCYTPPVTDNPKSKVEEPKRVRIKAQRRESNLSKVLPTDRLALDKQIEILGAFAAVYETNEGHPVSNEAAGAALTPTLKPNTVLTANAFFADIGILI